MLQQQMENMQKAMNELLQEKIEAIKVAMESLRQDFQSSHWQTYNIIRDIAVYLVDIVYRHLSCAHL